MVSQHVSYLQIGIETFFRHHNSNLSHHLDRDRKLCPKRICEHNSWAIEHIAHSCHLTGHPDLTWDHQVLKTSVIWPCRHLKYCTVTSRCYSYVVIFTTSLSWYHRDTKSNLCHAPRDVSDLSDVPRGSADTTPPNSDSQHRA